MSSRDGSRARFRPLTDTEKENAPKVTIPLLKRVFSYIVPYWQRMLVVLLCIIVSSWLSLQPSLLLGRIIDEGLIGGNLDLLIKLVLTIFGVTILSRLIGVFESYMNLWISQHVTYDMRNKMFSHLLKMSHRFFTATRQGEIITRINSDIRGVQEIISGTLTSIIENIILVTLALTAMYQRSAILATAGVLIVPFLILPTQTVGQTRWEITNKVQEKRDAINQILSESIGVSGQILVKLFAREKLEYEMYEATNSELINLNIKESMTGRWFRASMGVLMNIGPMALYLIGGLLMYRYGHTHLSVGDITVMVTLLGRLYRPVNLLLNMQVDIIRSMSLFTRVFAYYDMPVEIESKEDAIIPTKGFGGKLEFSNVYFQYNEEAKILHDISFTLEKGKSLALVGASGAGKSTIMNLIPRLYDVTEGRISLDGIDLRDIDLKWLRQNIGVVTQDTYLYNNTVRNNLQYANYDASEEMIMEACKKANIHDFIMGLPEAYETQVGNRGIKLSGGERQRIAIARILLKDPELILLDEATSSLDSISESLIQAAIEPLLKGKTSLVIAHRLSTIMFCDEILVLKQGRLVERGNHRELLEQGGEYKLLYETQFRKALDDAGLFV
ncbi:MAG: ABC transporter ATP-binding protein/permease [Oscillospiraceae bacterium]|nr:ABC transporter ATP-binding protein/permease [Oscillospiraceae bacterium]